MQLPPGWERQWWNSFSQGVLYHFDRFVCALDISIQLTILAAAAISPPRQGALLRPLIWLLPLAITVAQATFSALAPLARYLSLRSPLVALRRLSTTLAFLLHPVPSPLSAVDGPFTALRIMHVSSGCLIAFSLAFHCRLRLIPSVLLSIVTHLILSRLAFQVSHVICKPLIPLTIHHLPYAQTNHMPVTFLGTPACGTGSGCVTIWGRDPAANNCLTLQHGGACLTTRHALAVLASAASVMQSFTSHRPLGAPPSTLQHSSNNVS
jgi:hypothetical protein